MIRNIPEQSDIEEVLIARHGKTIHNRFKGASVAICGLGGLGSNIAMLLARAGVGKLHLIDYDKVELSNIHRQQYTLEQIGRNKAEAIKETLLKIAPYTEIVTDTVRVTEENIEELLKSEEIVCEAFDKPDAKAMLVNKVLELFPEKYVVAASGMAGLGSANEIRTRKITDRMYLCGDEVSDIKDGLGLVATRAMLCASHQAHMILRIIAEKTEP